MTVAVIVQARMTSKRFPGKIMADLCGKPVLHHVLTRCKQIVGADVVICALPDRPSSSRPEALAKELNCKVYRGCEDDVLDRYLRAARRFKADVIVRITADCPLIDPEVCSEVLHRLITHQADYVSNVCPRTFEKGLDCEAFTRWTLELAAKKATDPYDREHVTPWMQRQYHLNKINVESGKPRRARKNWCVDEKEDLERLRHMLCRKKAA